MDRSVSLSEEMLESVAFVGETLGPFFLYEPGEENVQPLYGSFATLDVDEAASEWPFVNQDDACAELLEIKKGIVSDSNDDALWEFRALFVGPAQKKMPPWGSVYTDRECVVFGESTLALRQWAREKGIKLPNVGTEPEDHIGLMFLLMAWIARNKPEVLQEYLENHLLTWAPHFMEGVNSQSDSSIFKGLASLSLKTFDGMKEEMELDVVEPRFYR